MLRLLQTETTETPRTYERMDMKDQVTKCILMIDRKETMQTVRSIIV